MWREWSSARTFSQSTCSAFWQILAAPFGLRADQTWSVVPISLRGKYPGVVSQHAENPKAPQVRVFVHTVWGCIISGRDGSACGSGHPLTASYWPRPFRLGDTVGQNRAGCATAGGAIATGRRATALKVKRTTGVRGRVGVRSARAASKFRAWTPRARPSARVPIATGIFPHPASSTRRCGEGAREIVGDARAWEDRIARWDRSAASA